MNETPDEQPRAFLSPADLRAWFAARGVVVSESTIRRHLAAGTLPGVRLGRCWWTAPAVPACWEAGTDLAPSDEESGTLLLAEPEPAAPIPFLVRRKHTKRS